jgi:uncharacterized membrane protein (UPF0127 family)
MADLRKKDGTIVASQVELADGLVRQTVGLMFRRNIPESYAMIFDMWLEQRIGIHMLFVFFPIDLVYLDKARRIVDIRRHLPAWYGIAFSRKRARFAIEMPAGSADRSGIGEGDVLVW